MDQGCKQLPQLSLWAAQSLGGSELPRKAFPGKSKAHRSALITGWSSITMARHVFVPFPASLKTEIYFLWYQDQQMLSKHLRVGLGRTSFFCLIIISTVHCGCGQRCQEFWHLFCLPPSWQRHRQLRIRLLPTCFLVINLSLHINVQLTF